MTSHKIYLILNIAFVVIGADTNAHTHTHNFKSLSQFEIYDLYLQSNDEMQKNV